MFPRPNRPDRPALAWLDAVRHGLDLLVAFATLRDAEAPPETDETTLTAGISWPRADTVPPATAAGRRRAAERAGLPAGADGAEQSARLPAADRAKESARLPAADRAKESARRRAADRASESALRPGPDRSDHRPSDRSLRRAADGAEPPASHPHRRPLRRASRLRRPGAVRHEPQPCLTPIVARRARPTRAPARGARH
jgi:hypothetical protein